MTHIDFFRFVTIIGQILYQKNHVSYTIFNILSEYYDWYTSNTHISWHFTFAEWDHEKREDVTRSYVLLITCIPGLEKTTPKVKQSARQTTFLCNRIRVFRSVPLTMVISCIRSSSNTFILITQWNSGWSTLFLIAHYRL